LQACDGAAPQSGAPSSPSSSLLSGADPKPVVGISHGVFILLSFLEVFPSIAIYPLLRFISWNLTTRCLAVTGGGRVGECSRASPDGL